MLADPLEAGGEAQQRRIRRGRRAPRRSSTPASLRSACRSCRRPACRPAPAPRAPRRCAISTPASAPRPVPTMIDIGVARPSAHGQAMISTATALTSACASRGSGPTDAQTAKVTAATAITAGTNQPATVSASRWIGARDRCASPTRRTIRASSVSLPTRSPRMMTLPVPFTVPPVTRLSGRLLDRDRLAGHHRLVDGAAALEHDAVDRDLLARPHAQPIADMDVRRAARRSRRRRRRRGGPSSGRARAGPDRRARAAAGAQLQHLAEEHERDDHRRRLEVDGHLIAVAAERGREQPGRQRRDDAVAVGGADAERDQREHVQVAVDAPTPSRGRRTASRPTARPASPARTVSTSSPPATWRAAAAVRAARPRS